MRHSPVLSRKPGTAALQALVVLGVAAAASIVLPRGAGGAQHDHGGSTPPATSAPKSAAPGSKVAQNSCDVCLERGALVDPNTYSGWNDTDVKKSYEAARKYPATLDLIHCFCECKESPRDRHKTLLTCFTSQHAAGCGICQHEAIMAAKLKDEGATDEEVEYTVESLHKTEGHKPTKGRGI